LDGGVPEAERVICVFMPDYPVSHDLFRFIRAGKAKQDTLTHRDYLGSLMGLGIKRDCIGDIFVHEGGADIVVLTEIAEFLMLEYKKAGRKQLTLRYISSDEIITGANDFTVITATVSSMRLDAIAGTIFKLSRSDSAELIKKGRILLNSTECLRPDKTVDEGDKITVRGKGKAEIVGIAGKTKKDRIRVEIKIFGKI
jgi:RNA-binding protein YlmH